MDEEVDKIYGDEGDIDGALLENAIIEEVETPLDDTAIDPLAIVDDPLALPVDEEEEA